MIEDLKNRAEDKIEFLDMPESIRTPGRTWTRYPDLELFETEPVEPEIEVEGDAEVYRNEEAAEKLGNKLLDAIKIEENRMNAIHAAAMNSLVYIRAEGETDIEITYDEKSAVFAHLVLETSQSSEVGVKEEFRGEAEVQTSFNELYIGENSTVDFGSVEAFDADLSYTHRKAVLERDAKINWLNSQFDGDMNRTKIETVLKGDGSSTEKTGVWYPTGSQHFDISLQVFHHGEHTECDMDSRAVVDDSARSVYEGLQQVQTGAENTKSFQDQNALVLSDRAEADASPKLMIENPEVEASHAASAGSIPEDELHYMKSRGIAKEEARRLVVKGYFEPVMGQIRLPGLRDAVREEVEKKLAE